MAAGEPCARNFQTTRLGPGRHDGPGDVVCVMELASMLSGERFSDRPASVCPVVGAILRAYNDNIDDHRRQDLYRFAADAVGTRGDFALQRRRSEAALGWVREGAAGTGGNGRRTLRKLPEEPEPGAGPERIADYVVASIPRSAIFKAGKGRWSDDAHVAVIGLIDCLIEMKTDVAIKPLLGEFVEPAELTEQSEWIVAAEEEAQLPEPVDAPGSSAEQTSDEVHAFPLPLDLGEPTVSHPVLVQRRRRRRYKLERSAELLGGVALVAFACAASKRIA